jgi:hypothetical protein
MRSIIADSKMGVKEALTEIEFELVVFGNQISTVEEAKKPLFCSVLLCIICLFV